MDEKLHRNIYIIEEGNKFELINQEECNIDYGRDSFNLLEHHIQNIMLLNY